MKYFLIIFFFCHLAWGKTEAYFTPSSDCENNIINLIKKAEKSIDVAVFAINNDAIVSALKEAHNKGIKIRILTDRVQASQKNSKVKELEDADIPLIRHKKYKIQHDKFAIFDGKKAVTGSYNWTNSASQKNAENCFFFSNKSVEKYKNRFEILWNLNSQSQTSQ